MTKKIINFILLIITGNILFSSCKKELSTLDMSKVDINTTATIPTTDWTGIDVTSGAVTDFITYTLSPSIQPGIQIPMKYIIEMDLKVNNFSTPVSLFSIIGIKKDTSIPLSIATINGKLLSSYFASVGQKYEIVIRERLNALNNNGVDVGDSVTKILGTYTVGNVYDDPDAISFPSLTLPGNFQYADNWTPEYTNARQIYSLTNNNIYQGFTYIDAGALTQWKFAQGSWSTNWGDVGIDGSYNGTLKPGGGNISIGAKSGTVGFYFITGNIAALTYECVPFTAFNLIINEGTPIPMSEIQGTYTTSVTGIYGNQWTTTQTVQATDKIQFQISGTGLTSGKTITFTLGAPFTTSSGSSRLKQNGVPLTVGTNGTKTITLDLVNGLYQCRIQ